MFVLFLQMVGHCTSWDWAKWTPRGWCALWERSRCSDTYVTHFHFACVFVWAGPQDRQLGLGLHIRDFGAAACADRCIYSRMFRLHNTYKKKTYAQCKLLLLVSVRDKCINHKKKKKCYCVISGAFYQWGGFETLRREHQGVRSTHQVK